jgi:hypothetical protein
MSPGGVGYALLLSLAMWLAILIALWLLMG